MKGRYWFLSILVLLSVCSYFFYTFYKLERTRKIEEIFGHQKIHARQAARSFNELFEKWNNVLFYLSNDHDIVQMNEPGKYKLNILLDALKSEVKGITRTDKTGKIIFTIPYNPGSLGADISKQKHMIKILSDKEPVLSDVFNAVQGFQAIVIHHPVMKNGKFDGTIAFLLDFRQIAKKILDEIKIGNSGYAWLLSGDGIELYCPVPGHAGKSIYETARGFPELLSLVDKMLSGKEGTATYTYDRAADKIINTKKIAYFIPVKINNTFWSIAVSYSENEITASLKDFGNKLIIIFVSIFLGCVFISYFGLRAWLIVKESGVSKNAENNLQENELFLRKSLEASRIGSYLLDVKAGRWKSSQVLDDILGLDENYNRGIDGLIALIHPEQREEFRQYLYQHVIVNHNRFEKILRILRHDNGNELRVFCNGELEFDEYGNTTVMVGTIQDVTEQKLVV